MSDDDIFDWPSHWTTGPFDIQMNKGRTQYQPTQPMTEFNLDCHGGNNGAVLIEGERVPFPTVCCDCGEALLGTYHVRGRMIAGGWQVYGWHDTCTEIT